MTELRSVFLVEGVRTPVGKYGGALSAVRSDDLLANVLRAVVERTGVDPAAVDEVIAGDTNQAGGDNRHVARMSLLLAGLPKDVGGAQGKPLCGPGPVAPPPAGTATSRRAGDPRSVRAGGAG